MELKLDKIEIAAYTARRKSEAQEEIDAQWRLWGFMFVCVMLLASFI